MKDITTTNKWLKIYLENASYKYRGTTYTKNEGDTFSYIKTVEDIDLYFSWYWEEKSNNYKWIARLTGYYDFEPNNSEIHPMLVMDINFVLKERIEYLNLYEKKMVGALKIFNK